MDAFAKPSDSDMPDIRHGQNGRLDRFVDSALLDMSAMNRALAEQFQP